MYPSETCTSTRCGISIRWPEDSTRQGFHQVDLHIIFKLIVSHIVSLCKVVFYLSLFRDAVAEMLFEQDNEEKSIATLLLDALVKVENLVWEMCSTRMRV